MEIVGAGARESMRGTLILLALSGSGVFTDGGSSWVVMTHDILQTDIELAKGLIGSNRPDDEVAVALARRGIDPAAAARLVDDLRNGRPVHPQMPAPEWVSSRRSGRRRSATDSHERSSLEPSEPRSTGHKRSHRPTREETKSKPIVWLVAGVVICLVIAGVVVLINHRKAGREADEKSQPVTRIPPAASAELAAGPVVLEIHPDGLRLGGTLLSRDAARENVAKLLGAPTRTNQVAGGSRLIYAFDRHGILVYSEKGAGTDSIVLDFEGIGGTNGATSPFVGTLRIDNHAIKGDTDSRALTSIKPLGLKDPGADAGIFGGQYNGLELIFAYLKTPQRLSLVEISLK